MGSFPLAAVVEKCRGSRKDLGPVLVCEVLGRFEEPRGAEINLHERLCGGTSPFRREGGGFTHDEGVNSVQSARLTQGLPQCPFLYSLARRVMLVDNHSRWK